MAPSSAAKKTSRALGTAPTLTAEVECKIVCWINLLRAEGVSVSRAMLRVRAVEIAREHGALAFHGSWSWQQRLLQRHRLAIRARARAGQITLDDADERAAELGDQVVRMMAELQIDRVYNADQTGKTILKESIKPTVFYDSQVLRMS